MENGKECHEIEDKVFPFILDVKLEIWSTMIIIIQLFAVFFHFQFTSPFRFIYLQMKISPTQSIIHVSVHNIGYTLHMKLEW